MITSPDSIETPNMSPNNSDNDDLRPIESDWSHQEVRVSVPAKRHSSRGNNDSEGIVQRRNFTIIETPNLSPSNSNSTDNDDLRPIE